MKLYVETEEGWKEVQKAYLRTKDGWLPISTELLMEIWTKEMRFRSLIFRVGLAVFSLIFLFAFLEHGLN